MEERIYGVLSSHTAECVFLGRNLRRGVRSTESPTRMPYL
jgi:hypothetical protein